MFKVKNNLTPFPIQDLFKSQVNNYDLRNKRSWQVSYAKTVASGTETIRYRGPKTWELSPNEIKESKTLIESKSKVKSWKPPGCPCRLCLDYVSLQICQIFPRHNC